MTRPNDAKALLNDHSILEWRRNAFPEVLKTLVEHDSILRSWIRFLIGIEAAVILALWALASTSRLDTLSFRILVLIIGAFGSWMALQFVGIIGRIKQWNNWYIRVVRQMQEDGGVHVVPVNVDKTPLPNRFSWRQPSSFFERVVAVATTSSLWLLNCLRRATDSRHAGAVGHNGAQKPATAPGDAGDRLPSADSSVGFRIILAGNTVFLASLWLAIIVLGYTYSPTQPQPTRVELGSDSLSRVLQGVEAYNQLGASNAARFHNSIDNLTVSISVSSNAIQAQIAELRREVSNRSESLLSIVSNRTELLLHSLSGGTASSRTNSPPGPP